MPQKPDGLREFSNQDQGMKYSSGPQVLTMPKDGPGSVEVRSRVGDARQFSPSAARNCGPIREVLTRVLPKKGIALEVGIRYRGARHLLREGAPRAPPAAERSRRSFARQHQSVEEDAQHRRARRMCDSAPRHRRARRGMGRGERPFDAMISLNMVHIAPSRSARPPCRARTP